MKDSYGKVNQSLASNSTMGGREGYESGHDTKRLSSQEMPNTRMNGYVTNMYAGPGSHKGSVKMKGKSEHSKQEDEVGRDYGV